MGKISEELDREETIFRRFPILSREGEEVGAFQLAIHFWGETDEMEVELEAPLMEMKKHLDALTAACRQATKKDCGVKANDEPLT